ncbi:hypothetical protein M5D96_007591, partial [Drosophila gunungcola]
ALRVLCLYFCIYSFVSFPHISGSLCFRGSHNSNSNSTAATATAQQQHKQAPRQQYA